MVSVLISGSVSQGRVLGVDPGERRIGLAVTDELGILASPLGTIERDSWSRDVMRIVEAVREHQIVRIVVGYPQTLRGEHGPQARRAARLAEEVRRAVEIPVVLFDERYSTVEASERLQGMKRARRHKAGIDAIAATVILQRYLDAIRSAMSASANADLPEVR